MFTAAVSVLVVAIAPLAASATPQKDEPRIISSTDAPMSGIGFDSEVAQANGFKIQTDASGEQSSVPVTANARKMVQANAVPYSTSSNLGKPTLRSTVRGNCGSSNFTLTVEGSQLLGATTGYTLRLPMISRIWSWTALSIHGIRSKPWNTTTPGGTTAKQKVLYTVNPYGWRGQVDIGSSVVLSDGTICSSGLPASGT